MKNKIFSLLKKMSITSDEVNYLVYRYLQESGFIHSSFAFGHESLVLKSDVKGATVAAGALVHTLQKGLLYMEAEAHLNDDGSERDCTRPFSLLGVHHCSSDSATKSSSSGRKKKTATTATATTTTATTASANHLHKKKKDTMDDITPTAMTEKKSSSAVPAGDVLLLDGHHAEVFKCHWNPTHPLLATGSGQLWHITTTTHHRVDRVIRQ